MSERNVQIRLVYYEDGKTFTVEVILAVAKSATEGEIMDTISRTACEAFRIAQAAIENS